MDDRLDLDIQRREAIEAELARRALAHKRRVARAVRHLARSLVVNRARARPNLAKIRSLIRRNRILLCENQ